MCDFNNENEKNISENPLAELCITDYILQNYILELYIRDERGIIPSPSAPGSDQDWQERVRARFYTSFWAPANTSSSENLLKNRKTEGGRFFLYRNKKVESNMYQR